MIHVSVTELGLVCAFMALVFIVPLMFKRSYSRLNKRIKTIEDKISKKP